MNHASREDFAEDNRYATDCGVACPECQDIHPSESIDGDTMWMFWVHPGQMSIAQCISRKHLFQFQAPGHGPTLDEYWTSWPTIQEVKASFKPKAK